MVDFLKIFFKKKDFCYGKTKSKKVGILIMKLVRLNKQTQGAIDRHKMSNTYSLNDCYNNYSYAKENAYDYCCDLYSKLNGYDFKIISYNTNQFSAGFYYKNENDNTTRFVYITKTYDRECIVE